MSESWEPSIAEPSGGESPLLDFRGKLKSYFKNDVTPQTGRPYAQIVFQFIELEVLESTDPYPLPTAEIRISYSEPSSDRGNSRWSGFSKSLRTIGISSMRDLEGKTQRWKRLPHAIATRREVTDPVTGEPVLDEQGRVSVVWENIPTPVWQVTEIEGFASTSTANSDGNILDYVLALAEGKTQAQFMEAAMDDRLVMRNSSLVTALTSGKFMEDNIEKGLLTRDVEGVLHKA